MQQFTIQLNPSFVVSIYGNAHNDIIKLRAKIRDRECILLNPYSKKRIKTRREGISVIKTLIKENKWKYKISKDRGIDKVIYFDIYL